MGNDTVVRVEVTASDGTSGEGVMLLQVNPTKVLAYENNPLYGVMFNQAIVDRYKLKSKEIRMDAYPYHFSAGGKTSTNLTYAWAINDTPIPVPAEKNSAVFRNSNNVTGASKISVSAENSTHLLQQAALNSNVNF